MSHVIEIKNLVVDFHHKRALDGLSLKVRQGEIFGFLGPNGAGKTTAIKALLGLISPDQGEVLLHGLPPSRLASRAKIGFLPEEATYYRFLSPAEILSFYGEIFGMPKRVLKDRIQNLLSLVGLSDVQNRPIHTFSKGMVQKVSLAQALIHEPETLILDEPTSGLDPLARMNLRKILTDLKKEGRTIFFSSHELSEVELICDSIAIIKEGRLVKAGLIHEVLGAHKDLPLERFFLETIRGEGEKS